MSTRSEIETRVATWAAAQSPPIPVAYENIKFVKPLSGCYLEIYLLGDNTKSRDLTAERQRTTGMFQVSCYAPLNTGMAKVESLAASIVALFPVIPKTGTVSIETPLSGSAGYVDDTFICIPVTGRYRVES